MPAFKVIQVECVDEIAVISFNNSSLTCRADDANGEGLSDDLARLLNEQGVSQLILKFSGVTLVSSGTIALFIAIRNQLVEKGGDLYLCQLDGHLGEMLQRLNLEGTVFQVFDTEDDALRSFGR